MTSPDVFEAPDPEELSKVIPGFAVGPLLASGPDSAVYSAIQTSLERQVALRIYSPAASADPERVKAVEATTRAMARLKHRNLIGLFDSGTREGMMYVVMEFVAGKPLARSLGGNPVHHAQVRSIITGVCEGLAHAHQNKIAHGKLTAHAILLNPDAEPKIGGFQGGDFEKNKLADIVAVGRLLYLMLTGVEDAARSVEPSVLAGSPKELDDVWFRCTQRDRKDAFDSAQQIVEALAKPRAKTAHAGSVAAPAGASPSPAKPAATTVVSSSSQWALVRNLVLIVVLIILIIKVWGMTQRKERELVEQQKAVQQRAKQEQERRYQEALKKKIVNQPNSPTHRPQTPNKKQPDVVQEIREAPLAEIREALAAGKRDVLPLGSVRRGDSAYLLVRELVSWPEACWLAERHGAHLAVPDESADLMWLQSIADGEPFWLGVGKGSKNSWQLVDGQPWEPDKEPAGLGRYLAMDKFGFLRSSGDQVRLSCILQWRMDGSNPGQLEERLASTSRSLSSDEPVHPPGTDFLGDSAYLVVARDVDWAEAKRLAGVAGGHLASASDAAEILQLQDMARNFTAGKPHWVGAHRKDKKWAWVTGDAWRDIRISGVSGKEDAALAVSSDSGWQSLREASEAAGFIIEWQMTGDPAGNTGGNANGKTDPGAAPANGGSGDSIGILDAQAKRLVKTAMDKRDRELKANASKMQSDLDTVFRNMNRTLQRDWKESMDEFKELIENNRVPEDVSALDVKLNGDMAKIASYAAGKQKALDAEFTASANQMREAYQRRLRDIMTKALEKDERQTVLDLKPKLDASENVDAWLNELGFKTPE